MEAGRPWRAGVRTVIVLNGSLPAHLSERSDYRRHIASGEEIYLQFDDVDNSAVWWLKKGDLRCGGCSPEPSKRGFGRITAGMRGRRGTLCLRQPPGGRA